MVESFVSRIVSQQMQNIFEKSDFKNSSPLAGKQRSRFFGVADHSFEQF
jgi:hypothetical protein